MAIVTSTINYLDNDTPLEAFIAYDDSITGQRPAVLVSHAWAGRNQFEQDKAVKLAKMGYLGFALDMYGKGVLGSSIEENAQLMQSFIDDRAMLQQRISAALYAIRVLPWTDDSQIAAIGYCFGGMCVLDLARSGASIAGVVSFHGLLGAPDMLDQKSIKAKVLVLHGHDDPMVPVEQVQALQNELSAFGADWQIHSYGKTMHAFTNPAANDPDFGTVYKSVADARSWQSMKNFLTELFV
jgi:dienelactone hydrolase